MANMPKTLWAWIKRDDVPYVSPMEFEWGGNEPTGPMVYTKDFYLRADTRTPNAELEEVAEWCESQARIFRQCGVRIPCTPNINLVKAQVFEESAKRIREVMK